MTVAVHTNIGRRLELLAALLDHEAGTGRGMGVVSVSARVGREKSQVSRGLASLVRERMADRDPETLEFSVGPAMLALAARAGSPHLLVVAQPVLEALAAEVGERADLAVVSDGQVLAVDSVAASNTVQSVGWTGRRTPLHCTAAGRVLLAGLDETAGRELVGAGPLPVAGPNGPTDPDDLFARVAEARRRGCAVADRELDPDVMAIAAPVSDGRGVTIAAVTVAGPAFRVAERIDEVGAAVRRAAAAISAAGRAGG